MGNKTDKEFDRVVSTDEGQRLAEAKNCLYFEASAKASAGVVDKMFDLVIDKVRLPLLRSVYVRV